jgi:hypothetical protein
MRLSKALSFFAFIASAAAVDASSRGWSTPFSVAEDGEGSTSVGAQEGASCTFAFSSRQGGAPPVEIDKFAAATLARRISRCFTKRLGDWTYTVCLGANGGSVTQASSGDQGTFDLGKTRVAVGDGPPNRVNFEEGDVCGTAHRKTEVSLHCGNEVALVEGREPRTCEYAFAVSDPDLCTLEAAFPRHPAEGGGGGGGGSGGFTMYQLLLPVVRDRIAAAGGNVDALGSAIKDGLRALAAEAPAKPAAASELTAQDVAGVGGASMGRDDSQRHGGLWSGLQPGQRDERSAWSLDLHATWPEEEGAAVGTWTCSSWSIDDLRRGGGVLLRAATLSVSLPAGGKPRVVSALARNAFRQALPLLVEVAEGEGGECSVVRLTVGGPGVEGGCRSHVEELAWVSITVGEA